MPGASVSSSMWQDCAIGYMKQYPQEVAPQVSEMAYFEPITEVKEAIDAWVRGEDERDLVLLKVAGGGKTNDMVYTIKSLLDVNSLLAVAEEPTMTFHAFAFNTNVVMEGVSRGIPPDVISTFNSWGNSLWVSNVNAKNKERLIMAGKYNRVRYKTIEPKVVPQFSRLAISTFFIHEYPETSAALVNLYRPFLSSLHDKVRAHALGCLGKASFHDVDALLLLVEKYELSKVLVSSMELLNLPEKQQLEQCHKLNDIKSMQDFGLAIMGPFVDFAILCSTETHISIGGKSINVLRNEVLNVNIPLPCGDFYSQKFIPATQ